MLSNVLTLATHESLEELAAIPFPVRPTIEGQESVIDVPIGVKTVYVHAAAPLSGWGLITCAETRFSIAQDTTGQQLANALADPAVIEAMHLLINPPPQPRFSKAQLAKLTGYESLHMGTNRVIECLKRHITVLRPLTPIDPEVEMAYAGSSQLAFI